MEIINSQKSLYEHIERVIKAFNKDKYLRVDVKTGKQRTSKMNRSLHLYCKIIAEELRERGITFEMFFKEGFEVPWTADIVKDNIWRPVQIAIFKEESTTKPTAQDYNDIYDSIHIKLLDWDIDIPWPSEESKNERIN